VPDFVIPRTVLAAALVVASVCAAPLFGQNIDAPTRLAAVGEAMIFRRSVLGDSLPFDACSVYEKSGRPDPFVSAILPGLRSLLDRPVNEPCSLPRPGADRRVERFVRVDSVVVADSIAQVHLHVRRGEWSHTEVYHLSVRPGGGAWAFREVRMTNPFHVMPPPPRPSSQRPR
jgi:hypothetical protein